MKSRNHCGQIPLSSNTDYAILFYIRVINVRKIEMTTNTIYVQDRLIVIQIQYSASTTDAPIIFTQDLVLNSRISFNDLIKYLTL